MTCVFLTLDVRRPRILCDTNGNGGRNEAFVRCGRSPAGAGRRGGGGRSACPAPYYKAPAYLPPAYNWSGFYIGVNGGGGFGNSTWDTTRVAQYLRRHRRRHHRLQLSDRPRCPRRRRRHRLGEHLPARPRRGCPAGCKTSDSWLSTVRGRLGYAADRFMPYVTGGAAFGNIKATTAGLTTQLDQCRLDRRRRPRIRHRPQLVAPRPNISTSISASSIAA